MKFRLPTHQPGYRVRSGPDAVRVERRGPAGYSVFRLFLSAVLLVFAAMPPAAVYAFSDGSWVAPLVSIPLFILFPWYPFLGLVAWGVGAVLGSYRWIEVDEAGRRVRALRDMHFLWGRQQVEVPEEDLRGLAVRLEDSELPGRVAWTSLEIKHPNRRWPWSSGLRSTSLPFHADELADRERLFGFAFEVARMLGWGGYVVERNDHLGARIALLRTPGAAGAEAVPEEPADGGGGEAAASLSAATADGGNDSPPPVGLPPFEPEALGGSWKVEAWEPGARVTVRKRGRTGKDLVAASVLGTLILNVPVLVAVAAILAGPAEDVGLFGRVVVAAVFVAVTLLYNAYLFTEGRTAREAEFDWSQGLCRLRADRRGVEVPLEAIEAVEVRGVRYTSGSREDARHACEVWIVTAEGTARIVETGAGPSETPAYAAAASMAEELADALGVSWSWEGWEERSLLDEVRSMWDRLLRRYRG